MQSLCKRSLSIYSTNGIVLHENYRGDKCRSYANDEFSASRRDVKNLNNID